MREGMRSAGDIIRDMINAGELDFIDATELPDTFKAREELKPPADGQKRPATRLKGTERA